MNEVRPASALRHQLGDYRQSESHDREHDCGPTEQKCQPETNQYAGEYLVPTRARCQAAQASQRPEKRCVHLCVRETRH